MKKFQLKYSAPKTKVNSAGKVEQQNQKKPDRYCATCSTITGYNKQRTAIGRKKL